jgi:hypothetical protein
MPSRGSLRGGSERARPTTSCFVSAACTMPPRPSHALSLALLSGTPVRYGRLRLITIEHAENVGCQCHSLRQCCGTPEILWINKTEKKPNNGKLFAPPLCTPLRDPISLCLDREQTSRNHDADRLGIRIHTGKSKSHFNAGAKRSGFVRRCAIGSRNNT